MSPHLNVSPRPIVQSAPWSYSTNQKLCKPACVHCHLSRWSVDRLDLNSLSLSLGLYLLILLNA